MAVVQSIQTAQQLSSPAKIGFEAIVTAGLVKNRLIENDHAIDSTLKLVKFVNTNASAGFGVFSAHATCIPSSCRHLSGDYPAKHSEFPEQCQCRTDENRTFQGGNDLHWRPILDRVLRDTLGRRIADHLDDP